MQLLRVQVPEFRALKDVDISFEKDFSPSVFPIGSQNGGGKSTLLQLIFTLLHCPLHPEREVFLKNILDGFNANYELKLLARCLFVDKGEEIIIEFLVTKDDMESENNVFYSSPQRLQKLETEIHEINDSAELLASYINRIHVNLDHGDLNEKDYYYIRNILNELEDEKILRKLMPKSIDIIRRLYRNEKEDKRFIQRINMELSEIASSLDDKLTIKLKEKNDIHNTIPVISKFLNQENLDFICTYNLSKNEAGSGALLYRCLSGQENPELILHNISNKIFLAAPSTQIFLFTSKESQKMLFKGDNQTRRYYSSVKNFEAELPGLFTYDFLSVDLLIEAFKSARDRDFRAAVQSGEYGNNYQSLITDLHLMLGNKKINVSPDLSEIVFKLSSDTDEDDIDLFPENLSHGELKRLSLYMWLRSRLIEDSIVLMDEVEIALHPDWQYQIVSDLVNWAPSNQYILATHSYEICQAVTPAHVKELEPKLIKAKN